MLIQLSIRNFALIDNFSLEFDSGLNVFTGETGAGKSILIDALRLVLGERFETSQIRDKNESCLIEAVFAVSPKELKRLPMLQPYLKEGDECLILKREITPEGRSKNYINQQFVNLSQLKEIGGLLVDIHGQYDHQRIFDRSSHREMIDAMAGIDPSEKSGPLFEYQELYQRYAELQSRRAALLERREGREREIDLLKYQIDEIEKVSPEPDEEPKLKEEKIYLAHAEKLYSLTSRILEVLNEDDHSVSSRLSGIYRDLTEWIKIDAAAESHKTEIDVVQGQMEETIRAISRYQEKLRFDPERLKEIEERLESLALLAKKYGNDFNEVQTFLKNAKEKLDQLVNNEVYQKDIDKELDKLLPLLEKKAAALSRLRQKAGQELQEAVLKDLKDLGIRHAQFECRIQKAEPGPAGKDDIEFFLSPNAGQPPMPLLKIASGGEAARTMLAIKHALAEVDQIPTIIFDEIDSNVGGRLGVCVGEKLKEISKQRQVFLITHLPQIASFANRHIKVSKTVLKGKTRVEYRMLEGDERVSELAQMMSGEKETKISKAHAEEMLKIAEG